MRIPNLRFKKRKILLQLACFLWPLVLAALGAEAKKSFDISADAAERTLATFAKQSGTEVLFSTEAAAGIRTNAIKGEMTPLDALNAMIDGTALVVVRDEKNGVWRITKGTTPSPKAEQALSATAGARPTTDSAVAEVVKMSPFEVISDTKGYYAANTMSGTRLNSKLEDLGAAISVVTKEQMDDFAMLDINDIFLYTAGTEGTGTYTDFSIDRNGSVLDNTSSDPAGANRVRGIGPANISFDGIATMGRVPIDPLSLDSVEVSRGPNANIIGLGGAGGTVNMVPATANLSRNRAQVVARGDSYGGYRGSLDINRVLLKNKLSIRASEMYEHDAFVRKPSGTGSERYSFMFKYRPWATTTVSASYANFRQWGNRPNVTPPRDSVSAAFFSQ